NGEGGTFAPEDMFEDKHGIFLTGEFLRDGDDQGIRCQLNTGAWFQDPGTSKLDFRAKGFKADFGWAITCHKAQGSEWEHVAILEDQRYGRTPEDLARWRYTAATRAKTKLTWIGANR